MRTLIVALGAVEPGVAVAGDVVAVSEGGIGERINRGLAHALAEGYAVAVIVPSVSEAARPTIDALRRGVASGEADIVFAVAHPPRGTLRWQAMAATAAALARLPFARNDEGDLFPAELGLQAARAGLRVATVATNLRLGAQPSPLALRRAAFVARVQPLHILYDRRFDCAPASPAYEAKLGYRTPHTLAAEIVPAAARVLDLGSADGYVARLLAGRGCSVIAVDRTVPAQDPGVPFVAHDLDHGLPPVDVAGFDTVLMLDVIEHLREPERFVDALAAAMAPGARLILSTGNVAFIVTRLMLLIGQFNYGKRGILDLTHARLFTRGTIARLLREAGLRIVARHAIPAPFPAALGGGWLARTLTAVNGALARVLPGLFAYQFLLVAEKRPQLPLASRRTERIP